MVPLKKIRDTISRQVSGRAQLPGVIIYIVDQKSNPPISGGYTCTILCHPNRYSEHWQYCGNILTTWPTKRREHIVIKASVILYEISNYISHFNDEKLCYMFGRDYIQENIARIAKLPKLVSELKKIFCQVGRSGRYVRMVGQWVTTTTKQQ